MFDELTDLELVELSDVFDNAIDDIKRERPFDHKLLWEVQDLQHLAWHAHCELTGCRCLHHPLRDSAGHLVEVF